MENKIDCWVFSNISNLTGHVVTMETLPGVTKNPDCICIGLKILIRGSPSKLILCILSLIDINQKTTNSTSHCLYFITTSLIIIYA